MDGSRVEANTDVKASATHHGGDEEEQSELQDTD